MKLQYNNQMALTELYCSKEDVTLLSFETTQCIPQGKVIMRGL